MNQFIEVDKDPNYKVNYVGFSTGNGAFGTWELPQGKFILGFV